MRGGCWLSTHATARPAYSRLQPAATTRLPAAGCDLIAAGRRRVAFVSGGRQQSTAIGGR